MGGIDLHVHSSLSACAQNEVSPSLILRQCRLRGIKLLAVTDHNAIDHALMMADETFSGGDPVILPGVEITSREEVHLLAYFEKPGDLENFWKGAERFLPEGANPAQVLGYQVLYDRLGEIRAIDRRMRQQSLAIGLDRLVALVHDSGGLAVPAHIDKNFFSLLSQLGYIDQSAPYDALEVSPFYWKEKKLAMGCRRRGFPLVSGSDCHTLEEIGHFFIEDKKGLVRDFATLKSFLENCRAKTA